MSYRIKGHWWQLSETSSSQRSPLSPFWSSIIRLFMYYFQQATSTWYVKRPTLVATDIIPSKLQSVREEWKWGLCILNTSRNRRAGWTCPWYSKVCEGWDKDENLGRWTAFTLNQHDLPLCTLAKESVMPTVRKALLDFEEGKWVSAHTIFRL